jgi:phage regulator Rha-like protein
METAHQIVARDEVPLTHLNGVAYADSRVIADQLDNEHRNVVDLLTNYQDEFEEFGQVRFETEAVRNSVGAVNQRRYALLNEDQCYLLLTYSRNSAKARQVKRGLVRAFKEVREGLLAQPQQSLSALDALEQMVTALRLQETRLHALEGGQSQLEQRFDDQPISAHADKERHIQTLIQQLAELNGGGTYNYRTAYGRFKAAFKLPGAFKTLKVSEYPAAVKLLTQWLEDARRDHGSLYN